ncbi:hypothetical protein SAY87_025274 [Trapa incisa]|uniref:Uncharacterized protein n=2 Tax=Trapa TaxID=22665 RepID=A0AAN7LI85_TRANT|nr:hypothetical protein SAY87_025274 [Trapa incisa]KAK4788653.1 hypothetical protein SAY86_019972 [Trapa natans]
MVDIPFVRTLIRRETLQSRRKIRVIIWLGKKSSKVVERSIKRKMKVKKGYVSIQVGLEDEGEDGVRQFHIPISSLYHPLFQQLLDRARDIYGYHSSGPLRLPCSVDDFLELQCQIDGEQLIPHIQNGHGHGHLPLPMAMALSFHGCLTR